MYTSELLSSVLLLVFCFFFLLYFISLGRVFRNIVNPFCFFLKLKSSVIYFDESALMNHF